MLETYPTAVDRVAGRLGAARLVPVVELPSVEAAVPLAEAIVAGGLDCVEITFRTPSARDGLAAIRERFPQVLLGAGTILSTEQVDAAVSTGADFVVSPGTNPAVVEACRERGIPIVPGVCTPTDIELARSHGLNLLKFFPAQAMGGVSLLKALCAPYRELSFVPTGGISLDNLGSYLELPQVIACGGSWMVSQAIVRAGDFARVERLVTEAVAAATAVSDD
jgi:2-dehydro-3-deoxyphosphogluconate aldolase/(4S)-4-hydroxy-2-oxoglutarate aldolase